MSSKSPGLPLGDHFFTIQLTLRVSGLIIEEEM